MLGEHADLSSPYESSKFMWIIATLATKLCSMMFLKTMMMTVTCLRTFNRIMDNVIYEVVCCIHYLRSERVGCAL